MSVCHNVHVDKGADVIVLEYTLNDPAEAMPMMDNNMRRPFERLIRKLLNYPRFVQIPVYISKRCEL